MYAFAIPKRTYVKETFTATTVSGSSVSVLSWKSYDLGVRAYVRQINISYNRATYTYYDSSSERDETASYTATIYVEGSNDNSSWTRIGSLKTGTLAINGTWRYIRLRDSDTSDDSCAITHTISYDKFSEKTGTKNDYTYYIDGCEAYVAKLGNEYYEVEVKG